MERIAPSLYSYEVGTTIKDTTIHEEPQNNIPPTGEKVIIPTIRRYGFLTAPILQRLINLQEHVTINALKSLRKLQQQGKVLKYTISFPSDRQDIDVYVLSPETRQINGAKAVFKYDMSDIPYILEHLSVSQWHTAVLEGKNAKEGFMAGKNFDAISGATITSVAVSSLINEGTKNIFAYFDKKEVNR